MLLIDGYNLLFAGPLEGDLEERRKRLIERVSGLGRRARLVFDHPAGSLPFGRTATPPGAEVEVRFTEEGVTADDEILRLLRETADRTAYTVVTSDRAIADEAARLRFSVIGSGDFWKAIERSQPPPRAGAKETGLAPGEVDFWMREFGLDDPDTPG